MDRLSAELLAPYRLDDLYREAEQARLPVTTATRPRRLLLPVVGRFLIRIGRWLECVNQPCPALAAQS